ncbi:MAG TPA: hypothetical protein VJ967_09635, partial [Clostridia bacterium]|nr:hypothetical protein [Clostridia bacterium]
VGLFLVEDKNYVQPFGALLGFWLGYLLEDRYLKVEVAAVWWRQGLKMAVGLLGLIGIRVGLKLLLGTVFPSDFMISNLIRYFFIGLWLTVGAPYVFRNCNIQYKKNE